jgi:UDP-N-acetylmuramoylalanine--D-glutamate ligase
MIDLSFLKGKKVGVVGLGKTGQATVEALKSSGVECKTYDDKSNPDKNFLDSLDMIVWSPGIDPNEHEMAIKAKERGIELVCDVDLLYRSCPKAVYIGVTGTNGKSTTVSLIQHILEENGIKSQLGGNIGNPAMGLEMLDETGAYVIELSSFQLELLKDIRFEVGGLLNISKDHLVRHKTMGNYADIKASLLDKSKIRVVSIDDEYCRAISDKLEDKITVSVEGEANLKLVNGRIDDFDLDIMQVDNLPYLKGKHNYQNIMFAYTMVRNATKIPVENIILAVLKFNGLKHRQQLVRIIDGVSFINDSKGTNCDATETALGTYENIMWILGGQAKGGGFDSLAPYLSKVKKAYIIGECEAELVEFFDKHNYNNYEVCKTLDVAVDKSSLDAEEGDCVLLSTACASWDQFDSFEHRGDTFIKLVEGL